ncbi:MAG TPA: DUF3352 domain-containing protein [Pyrinomonadaceae bacterium]|nr:DUF3352 domain-containing protein [Pyrinomonadaceae bacterium]
MKRLKRKPYLFGLAAALVVIGAAAVHFARPSKAESPRLERYLPADAIGFVEVNDLRAQALKVIDSEAWRAFTKENEAASSLFMMTANHTGALDASYAVALLGVGTTPEGKREPQFAVVAEFDGASARRTFENRVLRFAQNSDGKSIETKTEQYNDVTINVITPQGKHGFAYAQTGDTLYLSNASEAVKRLLDVRAGRLPTLETNQTFVQARARAKSVEGMFGFLDGAALTKLVDGAGAGGDNKGVEAFKQFFHGVGASSVESVAFTSTFEDGRVAERAFVVAPNKEGVLATVAANQPTQGALLALVPEDAVAAFDASIANAPQTFEQVVSLATQLSEQSGKKSPSDALAEFTEKTGVDFRGEILNSLGTEFCAAQLSAGDSPSGVVILNLKDEQAFTQALAKIAASKHHATSERDYKGVAIQHVEGENGHALEYAIVGGNFVASGKSSAVERVIDTAQGGGSLKSSAAYTAASASVVGQPQFVYYNSNADYLNHLGHTLKSSDDTFKTEGQSASLRPSFAYGVMRADGFYVEGHTPLGAFPRLLSGVASKLGEKKESGAE